MKKIYPLIAAILVLSFAATSQSSPGQIKPFFGKAGIKKKISELQLNVGASIAPKKLDTTAIRPLKFRLKKFANYTKPDKGDIVIGATGPEHGEENERLGAKSADVNSKSTTQEIWSNFLALNFYDNPIGWPPDPNGAVGSSQVIVATNLGIKVFEKPGVTDPPLLTPTGYNKKSAASNLFLPLDKFFSPVLPENSFTSDPHIRYDRLSKRWIIVAIEANPPLFENNSILLAISDGDRVTETSSFTYYSFNSSLFPYDSTAPYAPFLDYPMLGVDKNSVVIGGNQFGYDSIVMAGYVIDKALLLRGNLTVYPFELGNINFITGSNYGVIVPQGVNNDDPAATKSFFAGLSPSNDGIVIANIEYDKNHQPFLASETTVPVGNFNFPRDNSSPGGLTPIDQLDTRLFAAAIHKNKLTGERSLWTAHAIGVNQSGGFIAGSDSEFVDKARTASRWYEIKDIYSKANLGQKGTVHDSKIASGRRAIQYFNPSIAASGQGHAILSGTTDAYNQYLNVFVAGRYNNDAQNTLNDPIKATTSNAIYAPYVSSENGLHSYVGRWGDYSQTVVDPLDDQTIWTFQEYANVDDSYGVRVVQLKAPPPATPLPIGPFSNKTTTQVTLEGVSIENSGFFDPGKDLGGPGYNKLSVKSTGNILVSNVVFATPTKLTFTLSTKNKPAGNYTLVITNPDGQFVVANYSLTNDVAKTTNGNQTIERQQKPSIDIKAKVLISGTSVYPNPTEDNATIRIDALKENTIKIVLIELSGKKILEKNYKMSIGSNTVLVTLNNLTSGTYLAVIYNADNTLIATHKIIKR